MILQELHVKKLRNIKIIISIAAALFVIWLFFSRYRFHSQGFSVCGAHLMPDLITHLSISYFLNKPFKIFRYSTLFIAEQCCRILLPGRYLYHIVLLSLPCIRCIRPWE